MGKEVGPSANNTSVEYPRRVFSKTPILISASTQPCCGDIIIPVQVQDIDFMGVVSSAKRRIYDGTIPPPTPAEWKPAPTIHRFSRFICAFPRDVLSCVTPRKRQACGRSCRGSEELVRHHRLSATRLEEVLDEMICERATAVVHLFLVC